MPAALVGVEIPEPAADGAAAGDGAVGIW